MSSLDKRSKKMEKDDIWKEETGDDEMMGIEEAERDKALLEEIFNSED